MAAACSTRTAAGTADVCTDGTPSGSDPVNAVVSIPLVQNPSGQQAHDEQDHMLRSYLLSIIKRKLDGPAYNQVGHFKTLESAAADTVLRPALGPVLQFNRTGSVGYPIFLLVPVRLGVSYLSTDHLGALHKRLARLF
jgi:hypothetical protein